MAPFRLFSDSSRSLKWFGPAWVLRLVPFPHLYLLPSLLPDINRHQQVVFELYSSGTNSSNKAYFVRVLWGGRPMVTSTPLGTLNKVPIQDFFNCEGRVST